MRRAPLLPLVVLVVVVALGVPWGRSQEQARKYPEGAKVEQHDAMVADKHGQYGPADGGGTVRLLEQPDPPAQCTSPGRYLFEYTAGPLGIAVGGALFFQVSPFWGWTTPALMGPGGAAGSGNTRVSGEAAGVRLDAETIAPQCMVIRIADRPLPPEGKVRIEYGAAPPSIRVDTYAEAEEAFYFWVDGDGDGTRKLLAQDPHVAIAPGPAVDFVLHAPSEVATGAEFEVTIAFLDALANSAEDFVGEIELGGEGLELPAKVLFTPDDRARMRLRVRAAAAGIRHVFARWGDRERASNPIFVSDTPRRLLWADLHGHSQLSDGTGTPEDYYAYARDVAGLDVAVLTDHDHWGMRKLDQEPALWQRIRATTERFNAPGRFTTLLGYEWTSWLYGHRHVLYFEGEGEVLSSLDPPTDHPQGLWAALAVQKRKALTIPHHPAGGPVPIDWTIPPDPRFEPVVEIVSVHGSSESPDTARPIYAPVKGHYVRDALARGYRLGFVGSGDSHNGHPGLTHLGSPSGGMAAILAADNTREAVHDALHARTCYATSGPRILLWFRLGGTRLGGVAAAPDAPTPAAPHGEAARPLAPPYFGLVIGTDAIARVELVKNGAIVRRVDGNGSAQCSVEWLDAERKAGDVVYLRAIQADGNAAWSSPIFTE